VITEDVALPGGVDNSGVGRGLAEEAIDGQGYGAVARVGEP
jgi:hypothetical protein